MNYKERLAKLSTAIRRPTDTSAVADPGQPARGRSIQITVLLTSIAAEPQMGSAAVPPPRARRPST
jgi:hypothetical protein